MRKRLPRWVGLLWVAALGLAALSGGRLVTAQGVGQGSPTFMPGTALTLPDATDTPTPYFGPSPTPTPTLPPPPPGGGRVAVRVLVVRAGPSTDWVPIGGLEYGSVVYPKARSANGNWAAIDWEGQTGWILITLVLWDPRLDLNALPVLLPPVTATVATTGLPSATPQPSPEGTTLAPRLTPTEAPLPTSPPPPTPTLTPSATIRPMPTPVPSPTEGLGAIAPPATPTAEPSQLNSPLTWLPTIRFGGWGWAGLGGFAVLVVLYTLRRADARRELRRYADGFPLKTCPACRQGALHLEERVSRTLGIPVVRRSVRCTVCRSVLREVRPGQWRYLIDPLPDGYFAETYNGQLFSQEELAALAGEWDAASPPPGPLPPVELDSSFLAEMEERILSYEPEEPEIEEAQEGAGQEEDEET